LPETFEFGALEAPPQLVVEAGTAEERLRAFAAEARLRAREGGLAEGLAEARAVGEPALEAVGGALSARPETVLDVVGGALLRTSTRHRLVIEVNPEDLELVSGSAEGLAARLGGVQRLDVVAERRVERGGCIVRTEEGEIDARIGSQLERLGELMTEAGRRGDAPARLEAA